MPAWRSGGRDWRGLALSTALDVDAKTNIEPDTGCCDAHEDGAEGDVDIPALRSRLDEVAGLSETFKVLSDETRAALVHLLSIQELCVCDIAEVLGLSLPAVSHHLRLLKAMRLVKHRRRGKQVFYSLDDHHIVGLIRLAQEHHQEGR